MNEYKWNSDDGTRVVRLRDFASIVEGGNGWQQFQTYLAGEGQVDPWRTPEELLEMSLRDKLGELATELESRVDIATGVSASKQVARRLRLTRKESKGHASQKDTDELDTLEIIEDAFDVAERFLEDKSRTLSEIESYNVQVDPSWSAQGAE